MKFVYISLCFALILSCSDDDNTPESSDLSGSWIGITDYIDLDTNEPGSTRYRINLLQTDSGNLFGDGNTGYSDKPSNQTSDNEWSCNCDFQMTEVIFDPPKLQFRIKDDSGEDDEIFDGLISPDYEDIIGTIGYVDGPKDEVKFTKGI